MLTYHYVLEPDDNGTAMVLFPDIPEAIAVIEKDQDPRSQARPGLEAALQLYIDARRPIPTLPVRNPCIALTALDSAKVLLSNEMVRQGVQKAELARRLEAHMPQVDRLLDLSHSSKARPD
jgi:antitoxin HicB